MSPLNWTKTDIVWPDGAKLHKKKLKKKFEILVYGYEPPNPEMKRINGKILIYTQNLERKSEAWYEAQSGWGSGIVYLEIVFKIQKNW